MGTVRAAKVSMGGLIPGTPEYRKEAYRRVEEKKQKDPNYFLVDLFSNTKSSAPGRGIEFNLDIIDVASLIEFQDWKCAKTHRQLSIKTGCPNKASLDRIDNSRGYVPDNIQFVTTRYNFMKGEESQEDIDSLVRDAYYVMMLENNHDNQVQIQQNLPFTLFAGRSE